MYILFLYFIREEEPGDEESWIEDGLREQRNKKQIYVFKYEFQTSMKYFYACIYYCSS